MRDKNQLLGTKREKERKRDENIRRTNWMVKANAIWIRTCKAYDTNKISAFFRFVHGEKNRYNTTKFKVAEPSNNEDVLTIADTNRIKSLIEEPSNELGRARSWGSEKKRKLLQENMYRLDRQSLQQEIRWVMVKKLSEDYQYIERTSAHSPPSVPSWLGPFLRITMRRRFLYWTTTPVWGLASHNVTAARNNNNNS